MFRDRFWWTLALTIPVVLLSEDVQEWFGYTVPAFPGSALLPAILGWKVVLVRRSVGRAILVRIGAIVLSVAVAAAAARRTEESTEPGFGI